MTVALSQAMRPIVPALALACVPATAAAHLQLAFPQARTTEQKAGPCGGATAVRDPNRVTLIEPGATIEVQWDETIDHPGHFRVSFDADGTDFTIPLDFMDATQTENVLVDMIADRDVDLDPGRYSQTITLPDVTCENCTLQVIQMMYDKPPYGPEGGADIYFQCADLALRVGAGVPEPEPQPEPDDPLPPGQDPADPSEPGGPDNLVTGGCSAAGAPGILIGFALFTLRRRRRC